MNDLANNCCHLTDVLFDRSTIERSTTTVALAGTTSEHGCSNPEPQGRVENVFERSVTNP
jgi:hypothetical protein